eukprot:CAMPEP_0181293012 /NCGR_PEP_ID=MMETSP1101-20121128/2827_1 /TAXON_ID=46948 /ORGANISM="Rhodomonas abbreviata, Strain Caron Lab Isolate" /LENGTH=739 /DNA_ID=CAMNT_0023397549 /DNA_START=178 /DNA_END=2394 /DNA_ORIENTATION=-
MTDSIMNRQLVEAQFGWDEIEEEKHHGPMREAFGVESLAKFAEYMDDALPASTPLMDWMFGEKKVLRGHEKQWWQRERPRPHRGETADPRIPGKERREYEKKKKELERIAADKEEAEELLRKEKEEELRNKEEAAFEALATDEALKRRQSFFGRPAQKFALKKRQSQLERNEYEHQAATFAHLGTDAEIECKRNQELEREERSKKQKAASLAATYRAEEKGARAAAKGLGVGGRQLSEAKKKALDAEAEYAQKAREEEEKARRARENEERAAEIVKREEEKMRICTAQIKFLKAQAKAAFDDSARHEINEIQALVAEKLLLKDFKSVWEKKKAPAGSPLAIARQNKIDMYDLREDVVSMEMMMFVHWYTKNLTPKKDKKGEDDDEEEFPHHFQHKITEKGPEFENLPDPQAMMWIKSKQTPGMICLGQAGKTPPLANRKKMVAKQGECPAEWFKRQKLKKWDKPKIDEWNALQYEEEYWSEAKKRVTLNPEYFGEPPLGNYLSRKELEDGQKHGVSVLDPETFGRVWGQDERHHTVVKIDGIKVNLRHVPDFKWLCTWVPKEDVFNNKHRLRKPFESLQLGPQRKEPVEILCPGLHPMDALAKLNIFGTDNQPRVEARVIEFLEDRGDYVKEGDLIARFEVKNPRFAGKAAKFIPQAEMITGEMTQDEKDQMLEACLKNYEKDEKDNYTNFVLIYAPCDGKLTGMMRDEQSRVVSYDSVASIDTGEEGWENVILPVAEW